jgi:hypothetical protein
MTPVPVEARTRAARRIADEFAARGAEFVLLGGSTGRDQADRWSDVEIGVFWAAEPAGRRDVVAAAGGQDPRFFEYDLDELHWFDEWWYDGPAGRGLLVEVVHIMRDDLVTLMNRLDQDWPQTVAAALAYGTVLHGSPRPAPEYTAEVATTVTERYAQIDNFWRWRMFVDRGNLAALATHFAAVETAVTRVLFALNRTWWIGPKWAPRLAREMLVRPADLEPIEYANPSTAAARLTDRVEATYDLVAERLPDVDVERLRRIFRFARRPWPQGSATDTPD